MLLMEKYIQSLSEEICKSCNLTGVGVGMLSVVDKPFIAVAGHRSEGSSDLLENDDRWHIGSITKSMTSTVVAAQISQGLYEFHTSISELLKHIPVHSSNTDITVKQLLTHTAGLQANFSLIARMGKPGKSESAKNYRSRLISNVLNSASADKNPPEFLYSNVGYAVAGHIAETVADLNYETLVQREIFDKYKLSSAGFGAPRGVTPADEPMGHSSLFWLRRPADPFGNGFTDNGIELSAAGRVHMNFNDLLHYGQLHLLKDEKLDISAEQWKALHTPALQNYACGWVVEGQDNSDDYRLWHNGSNTLWYALLMLLPAKNVFLAFTINNGVVGKAEPAFFQAAQEIADRL